MSDGAFDYIKVGKPDAPEPFTMAQLFGAMSKMEADDASFVGCFYGDPGTRKTTRAMEMAQAITPPDKKILYVFTGKGWTSLMNFPHLMKRTIKMPFIRYEQIETLRVALLNSAIREKLNIGAVVFDEYNRMQDMDTDLLTKHRARLVNEGPKKYDKAGDEVYKDPDLPEWPEYNTTKVRMINLLNDLLVVPEVHSFFVCHTRFQKKTAKIEPDFPEKTGAAFISMIHSLYLCTKEDTPNGTAYPMELEGTTGTVSKNRIGGLPAVVYNVKPVIDAYNKWGATEKEPTVETPPESPVQPEAPVIKQEAPPEQEDILAKMMGE